MTSEAASGGTSKNFFWLVLGQVGGNPMVPPLNKSLYMCIVDVTWWSRALSLKADNYFSTGSDSLGLGCIRFPLFLQQRKNDVSTTKVRSTPITKPIIHPMPKPADVILLERPESVGAGTVGLVLVGVVVLVLAVRVGADPVAVGFTFTTDLALADELIISAIDLVVVDELTTAAVIIVCTTLLSISGTCELIITTCELVIMSVLYTALVLEVVKVGVSIVAPKLLVVIISILVVVVMVVTASVILLVGVGVTISMLVSVIVSIVGKRSSSSKPDPDIYV